jgi:hypothetical protein
MLKKIIQINTAIICGILLYLVLSGCSLFDNSRAANNAYIVSKYQKDVPFPIIMPAYFPSGIKPEISALSGPGPVDYPDSIQSVEIGMGFGDNRTERFIWIMEENFLTNVVPSRNSSVYVNISGIMVLEEENKLFWLPSQNGLLYAWNQKDVHYNVFIGGYDRTECRKVIESMIKQIIPQPTSEKQNE